MNSHIPDCLIEGYETLIDGITLPDVDDRHVVAAAIKGQAESIITFNLKDFPSSALDVYDIYAVHPDEFLSDMFELDASKVIEAARKHRASLRKPALTANEYLDCLQRQKLPNFVSKLRSFAITI
ncbi:PIN domain-containing protein [Parashewanella spongiae]|uniref:PIN domain-containing protein n=1 Tax=Parashewanella spongiae TaxID=342950 RepID=A0A3A6SZC4_9GAMM|nr:PIN domain-containing protein [Parashewanella spongiae]MCL1080311.1 PIN domain-containing protein [Parashewanella spongiae]RJY01469.1 PIN domain-containing protein [Parashewanella spongiae]